MVTAAASVHLRTALGDKAFDEGLEPKGTAAVRLDVVRSLLQSADRDERLCWSGTFQIDIASVVGPPPRRAWHHRRADRHGGTRTKSRSGQIGRKTVC